MASRVLLAVIGLIAISAATSISLAAAAVALFSILREPLGATWAAVVVAGVFALLVAIAVIVAGAVVRQAAPKPPSPADLREKLVDLVREKPVTSAGVALAVGLVAVLKPSLVTAVARAFFDSQTQSGGRRRR